VLKINICYPVDRRSRHSDEDGRRRHDDDDDEDYDRCVSHSLRTFDKKCHHRNIPQKWRP